MKKVAIIGIILAVLVIGIMSVLSLGNFSIPEDNDALSEPILDKEAEDLDPETKPPGRNLSIEFDEKMGLSAP